jgi:hypothetical protein
MLTEIFSSKTNIIYREQKEMAYVIDGQIMSVDELLGGGCTRFKRWAIKI